MSYGKVIYRSTNATVYNYGCWSGLYYRYPIENNFHNFSTEPIIESFRYRHHIFWICWYAQNIVIPNKVTHVHTSTATGLLPRDRVIGFVFPSRMKFLQVDLLVFVFDQIVHCYNLKYLCGRRSSFEFVRRNDHNKRQKKFLLFDL